MNGTTFIDEIVKRLDDEDKRATDHNIVIKIKQYYDLNQIINPHKKP